nr:ribonuclease H-like domain-containing protein [Tanacetum cinerariifolium]
MADFHHLDDAREIWPAMKARFSGNDESKKMRKTMLKQEFSEFSVSKEEGLHKGYDRSLEIDAKGGSSYGSRGTTVAPTHSAFIGAASTNTKMVYSDQPSHSSSITYTSTHSGSIMKDVLHSFVAENEPTQQLAYKYFEQEHVAIQRETKAKTLLLQSLPEDHMADFHHLDDAREIWLAVKARFGGNEKSKKMRKTMLKQEFSEFSVPEEEGLHKGYDRALPPSWSQDGSSYGSRSTTVAPTHSAFIGAASTNTKMVYSDQPSYSSLITYTSAPSGSIMEDVLHSFVAENEPTQQLAYEDFKQVDQLEMEELDIKWQMAILSLRINKFQKKAGRKINFKNKDSVRFNRRKARCYNSLQLGHFARECNVKKVGEKARYSAFKILEVKTKEPKAMASVDSMLNWNKHEAKNKTEEAEQVYGLMDGFELDSAYHAGNAASGVNHAAAEFAMMGISPKVQTCPFGCDSQLSKLKKNYEHLEKLYDDSFIQVQAYKNTVKTLELQKDWYHQTQLALEEKVRILFANLENTTNILKYSKTLYDQANIEKKE